VLKLGVPHMEARDEIAGLRYWNGDATVRLLEFDAPLNAMLLERCEPGTSLRDLPEEEQDVIIAGLLTRLWRQAPTSAEFRPLSRMIDFWSAETLNLEREWTDAGLVREGVRAFDDLVQSTTTRVLLATDLHAGNVLRAQREPWLAIDPKPFLGDPAYDATQHLLNCRARLRSDPAGTIGRFADLLGVDGERVHRWTFARVAAEPRENWSDAELLDLARRLS
jgi:streptomycin 6-kinase